MRIAIIITMAITIIISGILSLFVIAFYFNSKALPRNNKSPCNS